MLTRLLIFFFAFIFSSEGLAATNGTVTGYIKSVVVKETGDLLIQFDAPHENPNECASKDYVVVLAANKIYDQAFAIALAAQASGRRTSFYTVLDCHQAYTNTFSVAITAAMLSNN